MSDYNRENHHDDHHEDIERLREEAAEDHTNMALLVNSLYREVEKLRTQAVNVKEQYDKVYDERERLRADLERACEDPDAAVREENERLRATGASDG